MTDPLRQLAVCPFTIVVSSNEVAHGMDYTFTGMEGDDSECIIVPTVSRHLKTGDYALDGLEDKCCVERKQLEDIFMCCGKDRRRFHAEVERMAEMEFAVVVIEADWREIVNPAEYRPGWESQMSPYSVTETIAAWSIRYPRVHWWACGSRREAEKRTFSILQKFWGEQYG
jgi:ERCC4-type nuclease